MKLDPLVAQIIVVTNFNHFTTSDVRSAYLALKNDPYLEPNTAAVTSSTDYQQHLLAKLNHYKSELLLNIGETEAYKELYSEFPDLINGIQPQYNEARDNNTRILGKIRAIEGLLDQDKLLEKI